MGAFAEIVAEIEKMQIDHAGSNLCDDPQYSPNQVLKIVMAVREEAIWSEPEEGDL